MNEEQPILHPLVPGARIDGDWFNGTIPANIVAGENTLIDSTACFREYRAKGSVGLRTGRNVTFYRTSIGPKDDALIEIGNDTWIANASLVCNVRIRIGERVFIAGGVTIADSDFHPLTPAARLIDTIAISLAGDPARRPPIEAFPIEIGDDVWIGYNATILKGVVVGAGAVIAPCSVVTSDVPAGCTVAGNPARVVEPNA